MSDFRFYHSIEVRYADLSPQGHVNEAQHLTYMEQARFAYIQHLGLWDGDSFMDIGLIMAQARVRFLSPVRYGQNVRVGVRTQRLGNRSFDVEYGFEDLHTGKTLASGATVLVAYDYQQGESIEIPEVWRHAISTFEEIPPGPTESAVEADG